MSEEQNMPGEESTDDRPQTTGENQPIEENLQAVTDAELQTKNHKLQTEMEVHKHPHHVTHKKKWGEYLLEFCMLFLAVFLGFIAENIRESSVEHHREKQYMQSLINDLARDTAFLNSGFPKKEQRISAIDSVFLFFESQSEWKVIPGYVAQNMRRSGFDAQYDRNTGTFDQLKNAGGLRLIRKKEVADSIAAYDLLWGRADYWKQSYISNQQIGYSLLNKIFNARGLLTLYKNTSGVSGYPLKSIAAVSINIAYLDEFLNFLSRQKSITQQDKLFYEGISESAARLIVLIKKEYNLENE